MNYITLSAFLFANFNRFEFSLSSVLQCNLLEMGNEKKLRNGTHIVHHSSSNLTCFLPRAFLIQYFIQDYSNVAEFLISNIVFCCKMETLPNVRKNITKINAIRVWEHIFSPNFHRMCI